LIRKERFLNHLAGNSAIIGYTGDEIPLHSIEESFTHGDKAFDSYKRIQHSNRKVCTTDAVPRGRVDALLPGTMKSIPSTPTMIECLMNVLGSQPLYNSYSNICSIDIHVID